MSRQLSYVLLIVVILLGFAVRLHRLDDVPLRGDEAFSALNWAQMPIQQSLADIATIEPHPPLTYVIFHMWNLVIGGIDSPFALRMLGVFGNLIGIPAMYALVFLMTRNAGLALLAGFMWAIHPFEVWHSQDFRNYALWAGLSVTALWLGLRLRQHRRTVDWLLYGGFALVSGLVFYTELLILGALGLWYLMRYRQQRRFVMKFLLVQALVVVVVLVSFYILQGSLLGSGGYGGNVEPFRAPDYVTRFVPTLIFGDTMPPELTRLWLPLSAVVVLSMGIAWTMYRDIMTLLLVLIVVPLALLGVASTRMSIFHPRYVLAVVPAFIVLLVLGAHVASRYVCRFLAVPQHLITLIILTPWVMISVLTLHNYYTNPALRKAPAWDELGAFLNDTVTLDDLVVQLSTDSAFGYYYHGVAEDRGLPASPLQPADEIVAILEQAQSTYDSIYVVSNPIPDWQNADVVETWANDQMQLVRLSTASGLGIRQFKNWDVDQQQFEAPLTGFDATVELVGYDLFDEPLPTGELVLWVYWKPLSQTDTPLKSFVHLVGDFNPETGSPLWVQDDQFPQSGRLDSTTWQPEVVYRDVYYLPAEQLPAAEYQLLLGWYNPETGNRLLTDAELDSFPLATWRMP